MEFEENENSLKMEVSNEDDSSTEITIIHKRGIQLQLESDFSDTYVDLSLRKARILVQMLNRAIELNS